jgi:hypothetical protein
VSTRSTYGQEPLPTTIETCLRRIETVLQAESARTVGVGTVLRNTAYMNVREKTELSTVFVENVNGLLRKKDAIAQKQEKRI